MNVRDQRLEIRSQAIGMIITGMIQKDVATKLGVSLRSIKRWWRKHKLGKSQKNEVHPGRKSSVQKAAKMIISNQSAKEANLIGNWLK